jgi:uncharacterized membrane protein YfcA
MRCWGLFAMPLAVPRRGERVSSFATGLITGAITSATGVFVFPAVPYLQALSLRKNELVQALGLSFTVSTVALFAPGDGGLFCQGPFARRLEFAAALAGRAAGHGGRPGAARAVGEKNFKRLFFAGLLLTGLYMVVRGAMH